MTEDAGAAGRLLRCRIPRPEARAHLVCFPHAGGSASYFSRWSDEVPADIEVLTVQYPGRADRMFDDHISTMDAMVAHGRAALATLDKPMILFGHSMGAAVAYELAGEMRDVGAAPSLLVVSGREAPQFAHTGTVHTSGDAAVVDELRRLGGTEDELLSNNEFRAMVLPTIRADYRLVETYRARPRPPLPCPIDAMIGDRDPEVTQEEAQGWAVHTADRFSLRRFAGDHFYLDEHLPDVIDHLVDLIDGALSRRCVAEPGRAAR